MQEISRKKFNAYLLTFLKFRFWNIIPENFCFKWILCFISSGFLCPCETVPPLKLLPSARPLKAPYLTTEAPAGLIFLFNRKQWKWRCFSKILFQPQLIKVFYWWTKTQLRGLLIRKSWLIKIFSWLIVC